ncbi:MAG: hypothetical protein J6334_00730 [Kiritimatiellae bacterium]|nr:hypothetical protein [Kiritimatiellia bacterium]
MRVRGRASAPHYAKWFLQHGKLGVENNTTRIGIPSKLNPKGHHRTIITRGAAQRREAVLRVMKNLLTFD